MFRDFVSREIETNETTVFVRPSGSGPPLLLLHGFPETHLMWRDIAPLLAQDFTGCLLICLAVDKAAARRRHQPQFIFEALDGPADVAEDGNSGSNAFQWPDMITVGA